MIKVDGHNCLHELLNNKSGSALNTIRVLRAGLSITNSICIEVSWLNISFCTEILNEYLPEFPNISYAIFYRSHIDYLDPGYASEKDINNFNKWMVEKHPIKTDFMNLRVDKKIMITDHVNSSIEHLKNNIFWSRNDYYPEYFETDDDFPNTYYRFFKVIDSNKLNGWDIQKYHNIITENTVNYPEIYKTIKKELQR